MKVNGITALDYERQGNSLALATDDSTAKTLDSMAAKIMELQSASNDVMDALTELAGIVAGGGENNG